GCTWTSKKYRYISPIQQSIFSYFSDIVVSELYVKVKKEPFTLSLPLTCKPKRGLLSHGASPLSENNDASLAGTCFQTPSCAKRTNAAHELSVLTAIFSANLSLELSNGISPKLSNFPSCTRHSV